ncbi:Mitochondrial intermembrane space cysteine motif-containing protein MIX17 [Penicillium rolfsii]|nr:Mitochondrial intermembrane space cysteine motif-containing protein MIX17 [Penicillium rolfsii]
MPRQQRRAAPTPARSAPTRPTAAPARPAAPAPQQSQPHSTAAYPHQAAPPMQQAAPVQSSGGGFLSQVASTAAGVAAGHVAATGITNALGWGSSSHAAPAEAQQAAPAQNQAMDNGLWAGNATQQSWENPACETDIRNFRRCMDENKGDMSICGWYMDQLKACQAAAKPY